MMVILRHSRRCRVDGGASPIAIVKGANNWNPLAVE